MAATYETFTSSPLAALTLTDNFVQLRGTSGQFPAPIGSLAFQLIATLPAGGPKPLVPAIVLKAQSNGYGVFLFTSEGSIGSSPVLRIPPDQYRLLITSDFYQDATLDLAWPPDLSTPPVVLLKPAYAYPFPDLTMVSNQLTLIRGNLYQANGDRKPISGAMVSITVPANTWPFASCSTNQDGGWVLAIPLASTAAAITPTLHFVLPDTSSFDIAGVAVTLGEENSLPQTALRGFVLTTTGAPIPNAVITVAGLAGSSTSGSDGAWSYFMSLTQPNVMAAVTATAPGGGTQSQNMQIKNRTTVQVPPFRIA